MARKEQKIEDRVVHLAEREGFFTRKMSYVGRRAACDRLFAREDRGEVWIEFKKTGDDARLLQDLEHERMRAAGMETHVVDSVEEACRILGIPTE